MRIIAICGSRSTGAVPFGIQMAAFTTLQLDLCQRRELPLSTPLAGGPSHTALGPNVSKG
jgi:hypothetical protein